MRLLTALLIVAAPVAAAPVDDLATALRLRPTDPRAAHRIMQRLADRGSALAETVLGVGYRDGEGVRRDPATAATYFLRAANRGYPVAQLALAHAYSDGQGVEPDGNMAYFWARLAAVDLVPARSYAASLRRRLSAGRAAALDARASAWRPWSGPSR